MKNLLVFVFSLLSAFAVSLHASEFQSLFNGKNLSGWEGHDRFWSIRDGAIHGETTKENPTKGNTFLIWKGGDLADFEFRAMVRFRGNNSGVQYRSEIVDGETFGLRGYQADLHPKPEYFGMLYGEKLKPRGIIAQRGQRVEIGPDGKRRVTGTVGDMRPLTDWEWNEIRVLAAGNQLLHQVNGVTTVFVIDRHPEARSNGRLGLQLHAGPPMTVQFKDLRLRRLSPREADVAVAVALSEASKPQPKKPARKPDAESTKSKPDPKKAAAGTQPSPSVWVGEAPRPQWIWTSREGGVHYFHKTFAIPFPLKRASLYAVVDNHLTLWVNRKLIGESTSRQEPFQREITSHLKSGLNTLAIRAENRGGDAGVLLKLELTDEDGARSFILSDAGWAAGPETPGWTAPSFDPSEAKGWVPATVVAGFGDAPRRIPGGPKGESGGATAPKAETAADAESPLIRVPEGFRVEKLYEVPKQKQGSWVSLTKDTQGRLLASDQKNRGLFRIQPGNEVRVEKMPVELSGAQGMAVFRGALYFNQNGGRLHRIEDSNGDGRWDAAYELPSATGGGEHGNHAVVPADDGNELYVAGGNHSPLPELATSRVPTWSEDLLLPRQWDARGHARGRLAPGGWIARFAPDQQSYELVCIGFRNQYDLAGNEAGDFFTYDSDMEWDLGLPWYRPTRICQVVSGADYGWRSGSGKWPSYYEDSLPPVLEIGPGSPTGVVSGRGTRFPTRYQNAIFALDWTFGTIYAIHLRPHGAGYRGEAEPFCSGAPLPVTDAVAGEDGALYFTTGGRGMQSALYRITYHGEESTKPAPLAFSKKARSAHALRRHLETFHGRDDLNAVPHAWPHLENEDRFLRHAARIAIESQPPERWANGVFHASQPQTRITSAVALARRGSETHREQLYAALLELDPSTLSDSQFLGLLRAYALTAIRLGSPAGEQRDAVITQLDHHLPHENPDVNTELLRVLVRLRAPNVVAKGLELIANRGTPETPAWAELASRNPRYGAVVLRMLENHPPTRAIHYAFMLRNIRDGWTLQQRRRYFSFLNEAAKASGGHSYAGFLTNLREEALGNCTNEERKKLAGIVGEDFNPKPDFTITPPEGPGRVWTMENTSSVARRGNLRKADFKSGRNLFHAVGCAACHRFAGLGGDIGPDLTSVRNKYDVSYLLESILQPSEVISDQYSSKIVTLKDRKTLMGLVVEQGKELAVYPPSAEAEPTVVPKSEVRSIRPFPVSQMPGGMINALNESELRDLLAYLMSGGDPKSRVYK